MRRRLLRPLALLLAAAFVGAGLVGAGAWVPASAHGALVDGSPGPGDEVEAGVAVLRLVMEDVDEGAEAQVAVLDEGGEPLAVGEPTVLDDGVVCAASDPLPPGVWSIEYAARSSDGHRTGGQYSFEVTAGGEAADPGPCAGVDLPEPGEALTMAERTSVGGVPGWMIPTLVAMAVLAGAGVVWRVRQDRGAPD